MPSSNQRDNLPTYYGSWLLRRLAEAVLGNIGHPRHYPTAASDANPIRVKATVNHRPDVAQDQPTVQAALPPSESPITQAHLRADNVRKQLRYRHNQNR